MREIKFRAWDNNIKKIIVQDTTDRIDKVLHYWETHIKTTVMQYTGLRDKNGIEIYEGDIVSIDEPKNYFQVEWQDGAFILRNGYNIDKAYNLEFYKLEGNIYENKELLNVQ